MKNPTHTMLRNLFDEYLISNYNEDDLEDSIHLLFTKEGIRLRKDGSKLKQINISKTPRNENIVIVVGLRYEKIDKSHTEDHFLCEYNIYPNTKTYGIQHLPKRQLEQRFNEYKGSHKQQVDFSQPSVDPRSIPCCSTISCLPRYMGQ